MRSILYLASLAILAMSIPGAHASGTVNDVGSLVDGSTACGPGVVPLAQCEVNNAETFVFSVERDGLNEGGRDVGIVVGAVKGPVCNVLYGSPTSPQCPLTGPITIGPSPGPVILPVLA